MSTLYAVIWEDRHVDVAVHLFSDKDAAIVWAKKQSEESNINDWQDDENECPADWLAYFCYSCEGDHLRVIEVEVDAELQ